MINNILSPLIALFFLVKPTQSIYAKTQSSCFFKLFAFGVLSWITGVLIYKSNQVVEIVDHLTIEGIKSSRNSKGIVVDTVLAISIEKNLYTPLVQNKAFIAEKENSNYEDDGISVQYQFPYDSSLVSIIKKGYANRYWHEYHISQLKHYYITTLTHSTPSSFLPIFNSYDLEFTSPGEICSYSHAIWDVKNHPEYEYETKSLDNDVNRKVVFKNAYLEIDTFVTHNNYDIKNDTIIRTAPFLNDYSFNIFTAADISQYTHRISIESDCYIKNMYFNYGLPIEIELNDSVADIGTSGFSIKEKFINNNIKGSHLAFKVRFPTLANLQYIRSFILTTLIVIFLSFFFTNLFYELRKAAIVAKDKLKIVFHDEHIVRFKKSIFMLLYGMLSFIVLLSLRVLSDSPFHITSNLWDNFYYYILGCIVLILVVIITLYYITKKCQSIIIIYILEFTLLYALIHLAIFIF